ncbi:hypothetical protein SAOR_15250 [Salinisphaera orenii MK-B5]|uniref:Uncharacterized protein n=1 Tax=Salinisphaera orenii MK-B5 TaxID=856730 RepID=A0A423PG35_9GAMM|nr:hypothetical protein [Salinisphaera orenii]ROO24562.1 hypothetical protein SAOR_15250 [Salinisphaera orenii MK-B5]
MPDLPRSAGASHRRRPDDEAPSAFDIACRVNERTSALVIDDRDTPGAALATAATAALALYELDSRFTHASARAETALLGIDNPSQSAVRANALAGLMLLELATPAPDMRIVEQHLLRTLHLVEVYCGGRERLHRAIDDLRLGRRAQNDTRVGPHPESRYPHIP